MISNISTRSSVWTRIILAVAIVKRANFPFPTIFAWSILNYATTQNDPKPLKTSQNEPKGDLKRAKTTQNDPEQPKTS